MIQIKKIGAPTGCNAAFLNSIEHYLTHSRQPQIRAGAKSPNLDLLDFPDYWDNNEKNLRILKIPVQTFSTILVVSVG